MFLKSIDIIRRLGISWVISRLTSTLKSKSGWLKLRTPIKNWSLTSPEFEGKFFNNYLPISDDTSFVERCNDILDGKFSFFSRFYIETGFPPPWHSNPFVNRCSETENGLKEFSTQHWSKISDFAFGDIKGSWEIGRFAWVYMLILAYKKTKDERYAKAIWELISDWAKINPPNMGVHWKCGQEIAIRMFGVVTAFYSLKDSIATGSEEKKLTENIIFESAKRINANIGYAISQKNNHGISEAAGLFTAGVLFNRGNWLKKGKKLLEKQAKGLIYNDGSFSQHSTNYHRLMLNVFFWCIALGKANGVELTKETIARIRSAGLWLLNFLDPISGRTPNLGSNDGALLFPVTACDYLDYRPTIQAVGAVIDEKSWIDNGPWDYLAYWFKPDLLPNDDFGVKRHNSVFKYYPDGGYALWQNESTKVMFRCPQKFKHRPAQCDLLHVDVFYEGINLLRDSGTYSYNCDEPWQSYFKSVAAHNTIQFDDHEQMPEISRFLFGKWPEISVSVAKQNGSLSVEAKFTDWIGSQHTRKVEVNSGKLLIYDRISSFKENAVLRWRLAPELKWTLNEGVCISELCTIRVTADDGIDSIAVVEGWESLYYMDKNTLPVLEVTVSSRCSLLNTEIQFLTYQKGK